MAKQPKFSAEKLASELLAMGDATSSKVNFILSRIAGVASSQTRPSDKTAAYMLANVCEMLIRMGMPRNRISLSPAAPDGVERLVIKFPNMSIRLSLRLTGSGRELSCAYLTGSIKLPQLTSSHAVTEFVQSINNQCTGWLAEWEQVLFQGWQTAKAMEKAVGNIESFTSEKAKIAGLKYELTMLTNYADISIIISRGIKLKARVPHTKYEQSIDNLIREAKNLDKAIRGLSDDINISC